MACVYLAGPINGCDDATANDWRTQAKALLDCPTINPMSRDYRGREHGCEVAIVRGDKQDIDACDWMLVNAARPSWGTAMEILHAWERGLEVVAIHPLTPPISPWLVYHCRRIFPDLVAACSYINQNLPGTFRA
jgi:hypothetical protein